MTAKKILSPKAAATWRNRRSRVVFTNGVFDILHPGHIALLEKARSFGDYLIVGVNSDASVRRLDKGAERPINPLKARQRVLAALACVDAVTTFGEDTPEKLLSILKPTVLVKGADYKASQVAGRQHAKKLRLVALKKGHSTTRLVKKLKK
jgi:D-beta-D-heptose 7-phosphate kinase/D-beta-D-heptose 1-phosphate adenosyltransferase